MGDDLHLNSGLAVLKMQHAGLSDLGYEFVSYALLIATAVFTVWYPDHLRRAREPS